MNILLTDNTTYDLNSIPEEVDDMNFCVLSASDAEDIDFYFVPLVFLETFHAPAAVLRVGDKTIQMPLDWSILVCDSEYTAAEIMPLTALNDRGFYTPVFNPLKHMFPRPQEIRITNVYSDMKWFVPKIKNGNLLVVPLDDSKNPECLYFVKETSKIVDFDIANLFS